MRKVTIAKLTHDQIEVLERELNTFVVRKSSQLFALRHTDKYFTDLLLMDIAQRIYYNLEKRLRFPSKRAPSIECHVFEAILLVQVIIESSHPSGSFEHISLDSIKNKLHLLLTTIV